MQRWLEAENVQLEWQERALDGAAMLPLSNGSYENWTAWEELNPHVQIVLKYSAESEPGMLQRARLLNLDADYNAYLGQYTNTRTEAMEAYSQRNLLAISQRVLGSRHSITLKSMSELACNLQNEADHDQAEAMFRSVLSVY